MADAQENADAHAADNEPEAPPAVPAGGGGGREPDHAPTGAYRPGWRCTGGTTYQGGANAVPGGPGTPIVGADAA